MDERRGRGDQGEELAAAYLEAAGWSIEARNFRTELGEIDIIASREVPGGVLVAVVEVKSRTETSRLSPELSVTASKRRRIIRVARLYEAHFEDPRRGYRFDVIGVDLGTDPPEIQHFEGAFDSRGNPY